MILAWTLRLSIGYVYYLIGFVTLWAADKIDPSAGRLGNQLKTFGKYHGIS